MSIYERRLRSIPPSIRNHAQRRPLNIRLIGVTSAGPLAQGATDGNRKIASSGQNREIDWQRYVHEHNVLKSRPGRLTPHAEVRKDSPITRVMEVVDNCNVRGDLGVVLDFKGINLSRADFRKGVRDYGSGSAVFYSPVTCNGKPSALILATFGDIFETQVVPKMINKDPFFREESLIPGLGTDYDPTSMQVSAKGNIVAVSYQRLIR